MHLLNHKMFYGTSQIMLENSNIRVSFFLEHRNIQICVDMFSCSSFYCQINMPLVKCEIQSLANIKTLMACIIEQAI